MKPVERQIDAKVGHVWDLVGDVERWDALLPTMQRVTRIDGGGTVGEGARFEVRQPGLPKAVYEITEWKPGVGFTWVAASVGVSTTATHEVTPSDGGALLVLGIAWSGPLAGLVGLLMGRKTRRMVEQEADTFAELAMQGRAR
jgi:ligand-binding SRPBCC domain-containing protein